MSKDRFFIVVFTSIILFGLLVVGPFLSFITGQVIEVNVVENKDVNVTPTTTTDTNSIEFFYNNTWYRVKLEYGAPVEVITVPKNVEKQGISFILTDFNKEQVYSPITITFYRSEDGVFDLINCENFTDTIFPRFYTNNMFVLEGDEFIIKMEQPGEYYPIWYYFKVGHGNPVVEIGINNLIEQTYPTLSGETHYKYRVDISNNDVESVVSLVRKGDVFSRWSLGELRIKSK